MDEDRIIDEVDSIADLAESYIANHARERALAARIEPEALTRRVIQELYDRADIF